MVWHLDVGSSHPGAGAGPKGWAVRPLKRHASWVQNVESLRLLEVIPGCKLAVSVKPHLPFPNGQRAIPREDRHQKCRIQPAHTSRDSLMAMEALFPTSPSS